MDNKTIEIIDDGPSYFRAYNTEDEDIFKHLTGRVAISHENFEWFEQMADIHGLKVLDFREFSR